MKYSKSLVYLALCLFVLPFSSTAVSGQDTSPRDHLTVGENDLVQDAESPEARTQVYIRAADRRLIAITDPKTSRSREAVIDTEKWGTFPTGTRTELLGDVVGILGEAIKYIDDAASRDVTPKSYSKAVHALAAAAKRWRSTLESLKHNARGDEGRFLDEAIEHIDAIIEAEGRLPPGKEKD